MGFVQELDQVEQLRKRVADLETQLQDKEHLLRQERQKGEQKLRALMNNLPVILYAVDTNGIITLSEGKGLAINGLKPGQTVGADAYDLFNGYSEATAGLKRALAGESFQFIQKTADVYLQTWYSPTYDESGNLIGTLGLMIDVSDRVRVETDLLESRNLLQTVLDAIPVRVYWKDIQSKYMGGNQLFAQDAQLSSSTDITGKTDYDFYPNEAGIYQAEDLKVITTGESFINVDVSTPLPDGTKAWTRTSKIPLRNVAGEIVGVLGTYDNITERKKAETELRESKDRLELAFQTANLASWDWNMVTNDVVFDDGFNRMLGYEPGSLGNDLSGFADNLHPDDKERTFKAVNDYAEGRASKYETEFRLKHKDGSWRWVAAYGQIVERQADGKTVRMIGVNKDITDRKQADLELQASRDRLELAFGAGNLGSWDWDLITNETLYDKRYAQMLGYEVDEITNGKVNVEALIHPDDGPAVIKQVMDYVAGLQPAYTVEYRIKTKSGDWKWIYATGQIVERKEDGTPVRIIGINQDITARKQTEIQLRESKNRLELALESAHLGLWDGSWNSQRFNVDERYERMLGFAPGELAGEHPTSQSNVHPEDLPRLLSAMTDYISGKMPVYSVEFRTQAKNGDWKWIAAKAEIVEWDADGKPLRLAGINQDITERKQAEMEIKAAKDRLELAMDGAQLGSWEANLITNKTVFDARYEKMLGFAPGELAGENPTHVTNVHPDDMVRMGQVVMDYVMGKTPEYEIEFRTETKTGEWKWIYAKAQIVERLPDGTPLRLAGVNQDINARKLAEQERETLLNNEREARREAQEALRMKDLFLATMSHELRTPLNAMIGFQHLMLFSQQLDADNAHMAERSIANSQRLLNLINNILDISRIATGGLKIVPVNMSPRNLAIGIGTDLNLQAKEKGLKLKIEVGDSVPAQIVHDEERMGQIMLNLVGNALKFTEPNGTITLRVNTDNERLVIEVQDTGIGIPASQKHVIFDDFVQLDNSSTRKHQGAGLGLAIVKRLALLMQGSITVESEVGQGSTFVVTLPLNLKPEMYQ